MYPPQVPYCMIRCTLYPIDLCQSVYYWHLLRNSDLFILCEYLQIFTFVKNVSFFKVIYPSILQKKISRRNWENYNIEQRGNVKLLSQENCCVFFMKPILYAIENMMLRESIKKQNHIEIGKLKLVIGF